MKSLNQDTLDSQNDPQISLIERVILYEQYEGRIVSSTVDTVVVEGDATGFFSADNVVLFPLVYFESETTVTQAVYDAPTDRTYMIIASFEGSYQDYVGTQIAKKVDVSDYLTRNGIKSVSSAIEGRNLGEFDSGSLDVIMDNSNGYFVAKDGTGLLDSGNVFWTKYTIKNKGTSDTIIYFGGLLDLTNLSPDLYDKTIILRTLGHSYELGRYPAFYFMDEENDILPRLGGIILRGFTSTPETEEGIKRVSYQPFTNSEMKGITIESVSRDTVPGIKVFEFRYPSNFRWNNGDWVEMLTNPIHDPDNPDPDIPESGQIKMYEYGGENYAIVRVGDNAELDEFPDKDVDMWVLVKDERKENFGKTVSDQGKPILSFDNGIPEVLIYYFQRILLYTDSYTEVTADINQPEETQQVLVANDDELIIISPYRFFGMVFDLFTAFSAFDYTIHYSIGGELWSADFSGDPNFSTDTADLTQNGYIKWGSFNSWVKNNISPDENTEYKGYMIKIKRVTASGTCVVKSLKRMMRAQGENGDFIEFDLHKESLEVETLQDSILIKLTNEGEWIYGTWMNNVSVQGVFNKMTELSYFNSSKIESDDLEISRSERSFNIWGRPPRYSFHQEPTCFHVTSTHVYVAVGWEVWRATFIGTWEKVCDLYNQGLVEETTWKNYILRLYVYNNNLYILVSDTNLYQGVGSYVFIYDLVLGGTPLIIGTRTNSFNGLWQTRKGRQYEQRDEDEARKIGPKTGGIGSEDGGESMCYPFRQQVWCDELERKVVIRPAGGVEIGAISGPYEWRFTENFEIINDKQAGPTFIIDNGYYTANNIQPTGDVPDPYNIPIQTGQIGMIKIYEDVGVGLDIWIFQKKDEPVSNKDYWVTIDAISGTETIPRLMRSYLADIPIAHCLGSAYDYWAFTQARDKDETDYVAPSYITRSTIVRDWKRVALTDSSDVETAIVTDLVNNGTAVTNLFPTLNSNLVFGHDRKLKTIRLDITNAGSNFYDIYYSTGGTNWEEWDDLLLPNKSEQFLNDWYGVDMPDDWAEHSVYGFAIKIEMRLGPTGGQLNVAYPTEQVVWDSANESSEDQRQQIVNMSYDASNNVIIGCMFNRDDTGTYPFQWSLFTFDIATETMNIIHTATNYTFEGTYLYKNFTWNGDDGVMYACSENRRYQDTSGFLIEIDYNGGSPTINKLGTPRETDWGAVDQMQYINGKLFGITKGTDFVLWEYSKTYSPRIELVEYSESDTARTVLKDICLMMNFYYMITSERLLRMMERENTSGSIELKWDENMITSKPTFPYWNNYFDAVRVSWKNLFSGTNGNKKSGYSGWKRKIMPMSNSLIQNLHIAGVVSTEQYEFYNQFRLAPEKIKTHLLQQLEVMDEMTIYMPPQMGDIDSSVEYIITGIELMSNKQLIIKGLEKKDE